MANKITYEELEQRVKELEGKLAKSKQNEMLNKAKEELAKHRQNLEELVEKRTAELNRINENLRKEIAKRKRTEEVLKESKEKFENLAECSPNMIFINKKGKVVYANKKCEEIMNYKREEFYSPDFNFLCLIAPEHTNLIRENLRKHMDVEEVTPYEYSLITKTGKRIEGIITTKLIKYEGDSAILGIVTDITERKRAEKALRESEEQYRNLYETALVSLWRTRIQDGKLLKINLTAVKLFGYKSVDDVIAEDVVVTDFYPVEQRTEIINKLKEQKEIADHDIHVTLRDGTERDVSISAKIFPEKGYIEGALIDITERKRAEKEIRKLNEELEQRVIARTAELEAVNNELKDFAYIVSHDLKAPLRGVSQISNWLLSDYADTLDPEGKKLISILGDRVIRMHSLVDGVLQYSRIGRIREKLVHIDLNVLVKDVISDLELPDNIHITIEGDLPVIVFERTRIDQVFRNLIDNAVRFMDKPKGEIRVACADEGGNWKFSVTDNGPGIDDKYYEKIFQIFQTLVSRDEVESTGVGLTIVRKIIELYGGKIWVESRKGQGSIFFFTLTKLGADK